jgi:hypothetical protein
MFLQEHYVKIADMFPQEHFPAQNGLCAAQYPWAARTGESPVPTRPVPLYASDIIVE